jgi:hypothetical protein
MVESTRDPDPTAPQNPPRSVLNERARQSALWTYLAPLVLFFAGVAAILVYWGTSPPTRDRQVMEPAAQGTSGTERQPSHESTPGGHNPDRTISDPTDEREYRGGRAITELHEIFKDNSRDAIGRRVELSDVAIERVDSPTLFWVADADARVAVACDPGIDPVRVGQSVNLDGTIERSSDGVRIRASRVEPTR